MWESDPEDSLRLTLSPPRMISHSSDRSKGSCAAQMDTMQCGPWQVGGGTKRLSESGGDSSIAPPHPWATDKRAVVRQLSEIIGSGITSIEGNVKCKRCNAVHTREVNVEKGFERVSEYFVRHRECMHDRAPKVWLVPRLLDCHVCNERECAKPVIESKKRCINWLFLLLTETLGVCKLEQLKYFCKHTRKHRTGAKDRVLYLTYAALLKQLHPSGPFD